MELFSIDSSYSLPSVKPKEFKVDFTNVRDRYAYAGDLVCNYNLDGYKTQEGDRVAIFKLGWSYVREYLLFEWAPVTTESFSSVTFNRLSLPKNTDDMYQFCYITHENEVLGASPLFQFGDASNSQNLFGGKDAGSITTDCCKEKKPEKPAVLDSTATMCKNQHCRQLREENSLLRESLKAVLLSAKRNCRHDEELAELKELVLGLRDIVNAQQNEIAALRGEIAQKTKGIADRDFEIGELESIPPFPFTAKQP